MEERACLSPREVATLLGVGERQAREWISRGHIYSFRIGRRILVPRCQVERLLNAPRVVGVSTGAVGRVVSTGDAEEPSQSRMTEEALA